MCSPYWSKGRTLGRLYGM
ncbi:hypothetical protein E2I00_013481 [Balaenoptera physalus]|uniref:Uncharacterized protein n=1 Tax=Balaenoptera physalus TaxID=9770 RepID=A0A643BS55_BALPH|nr:hypothetical protein E2I00_013481 [Balaenoptera physalus]